MDTKNIDLISLFEKTLKGIKEEELYSTGIVVQAGDGICKVYGLNEAVYGELVKFESGNSGIILNLSEEFVTIFLLENMVVKENELVRRVGDVLKIGVGKNLIGRVVNSLGMPIDGLGEIEVEQYMPVEAPAALITERTPINSPFKTGILAIDALIPIGKGQRELIIGNRSVGKTAIAIDTILNQAGKDIICIYVSIGQMQGNLARTVHLLEEYNALEYTLIVSSDAGESVINQYLAPYSATAIGEFFMHQGKDVLIVYDDLTNHAIAYREMSLLMRRAPGREAYPGDVFYLHSRLLERSANLLKGGSMTALPIIQIQEDDITSYIPTNLISITDGQIFLDTQLFNNGIKPAINIELSVSRVGGAAQKNAVKKLSKALRLELAQYNELLNFAQFGSELDEVSQRALKKGSIAMELLKQPQYLKYSFVDEVLILFLLNYDFLYDINLSDISIFVSKFISYVESVYFEFYNEINETGDLTFDMIEKLKQIILELKSLFVSENKNFE